VVNVRTKGQLLGYEEEEKEQANKSEEDGKSDEGT